MRLVRFLATCAFVLFAAVANATPPPRGGVMWIDVNGRVAAPYIPNIGYYFDDSGRIWRLNGLNVEPYYTAYQAYYESANCTGAAYTVLDPALPVVAGCVLDINGSRYSIPQSMSSTFINVVSAWNGSSCTTSPWPSGGKWGWLISSLVTVSDPIPTALTGPLHLEWR